VYSVLLVHYQSRLPCGRTPFRSNFLNGSVRLNSSPSAVPPPVQDMVARVNASLFNLMKYYEDLIGLTEVKIAQRLVLEAERDFTKTQESRREKQDEIREIQSRLKEIHVELDKTSRGEDRYLNLLTQEHSVIKQERQLMDDFKRLERSERDCFTILSNRLRDSHEKERERAEKTKYGSIIGSIVCGMIGIVGGTIVNRGRLKEIKNIVKDSSESAHLQILTEELASAVDKQQSKINNFINELNGMLTNKPTFQSVEKGAFSSLETLATSEDVRNDEQIDTILAALKIQDDKLVEEMNEIKRLIAVKSGQDLINCGESNGKSVIYIGPDLRTMLDETEKSLESKIKLSTLVQVVAVYGTLAITLPLLYAWLR
uniref:Coiled-coil domain-containing protein 51 n=1 Tax=Romanomermis culicivorax TaxID=13658 RepID=A0A915KWK4_ROMCU